MVGVKAKKMSTGFGIWHRIAHPGNMINAGNTNKFCGFRLDTKLFKHFFDSVESDGKPSYLKSTEQHEKELKFWKNKPNEMVLSSTINVKYVRESMGCVCFSIV